MVRLTGNAYDCPIWAVHVGVQSVRGRIETETEFGL